MSDYEEMTAAQTEEAHRRFREADTPDAAGQGMSKRRREIGYVCWRGHYLFRGEEDYAACGSKKLATIYVEALSPDAEFDVRDYERNLNKAHTDLVGELRRLSAE